MVCLIQLSLHLSKKILDVDVCVAESAFQRIAIYLAMKWKHYSSAVGVLHFHMAPPSIDFNKSEAIQCRENLPAR